MIAEKRNTIASRKKTVCFFLLIFLMSFTALLAVRVLTPAKEFQNSKLTANISISGAWALYPLAARWAEVFQQEYPGVKIDLQAGGAGKGMADVLSGLVDIGMLSRDVHPEEISRGAWPLVVAKDAVVGTVNSKNPFLGSILERGITSKELRAIFIEGKIRFWEELFASVPKTPIRTYIRSDACGAAETWAAFLGAHQEDLKGVAIFGDPGLAEAVRRDPLGIGFNNLNFAYNPRTLKPHEGLAIIPLDLNSDGEISPEENFYQDRTTLTAAIKNGLYPSPPARDLFLVVKMNLQKEAVLVFLEWVLTRGQSLVEQAGYLTPDDEILKQQRQKIQELRKR